MADILMFFLTLRDEGFKIHGGDGNNGVRDQAMGLLPLIDFLNNYHDTHSKDILSSKPTKSGRKRLLIVFNSIL